MKYVKPEIEVVALEIKENIAMNFDEVSNPNKTPIEE